MAFGDIKVGDRMTVPLLERPKWWQIWKRPQLVARQYEVIGRAKSDAKYANDDIAFIAAAADFAQSDRFAPDLECYRDLVESAVRVAGLPPRPRSRDISRDREGLGAHD